MEDINHAQIGMFLSYECFQKIYGQFDTLVNDLNHEAILQYFMLTSPKYMCSLIVLLMSKVYLCYLDNILTIYLFEFT